MSRSAVVKADLATHLRRTAVLMLVLGMAAGCGRKGSLEPPPGASTKSDTAKSGSDAGTQQQQGGISALRAKKPAPVLPSKEPSILDPILE
jgi:predicted small lipoprotein YifL